MDLDQRARWILGVFEHVTGLDEIEPGLCDVRSILAAADLTYRD